MKNSSDLTKLFISNPELAIEECKKIICSVSNFDTFDNFYSFHLQHPHISTCQKEWANEQMAIHCYNCAKDIDSCICLECFLKGNHQGHDIEIRPDAIGNCDCGDFTLWKHSGFCKEHPGVEENSHPELYLDEKLRTTLIDLIFKSIFSSLKYLRQNEDDKIDTIIEFASTFLKFGDGFRRLISISLTEKVDFEYIINNIFDSSTEFNESIQSFCGKLINDSIFRINFAKICFKFLIEKYLQTEYDCIVYQTDKSNYSIWDSFWFHSFNSKPIEKSIVLFNFDWISFMLKFISEMKRFMCLIGYFDSEYPDYFNSFYNIVKIGTEIQPEEQTQRFFDDIFSKILNCGTIENKNDTIIVTSPKFSYEKGYFYFPYEISLILLDLLQNFKYKTNLKFDKLIEELDKTIDIVKIFNLNFNLVGKNEYNENDMFISRFLKESKDDRILYSFHYESFHNGASFFLTFPLFDSLVYLFRNDNLSRVKIGRLLSIEKYQSLRVQLGIVTLKKILSFICYHQSLAANLNFGIQSIMNRLNQHCYMSSNISLYLPLFQMLIGLQCKDKNIIDEFSLKEFFAFEIEREIGLFDDFTDDGYQDENLSEKQTQMIFSVLYLSLLIVIERTLFNYDGYKFIEEQIILGLKKGNLNIDDLNLIYDCEADSMDKYFQIFNSIISKVAINKNSNKTEINGEKETTFYLKDDVEWKTITALNLFNDQKVLLNDEISKHPDTLIKIPNFEPEETFFFKQDENYKIDSSGLNIRLKEFLLTPSILALVYYTLSSNNESHLTKSELNDHLAMNILILASKFANEIEPSFFTPFKQSTIINYDSSLLDLTSKFKRIIFKLNKDKNGNATIKNTLNKKTFNSFLKIKISANDQKPKSFIDILLERGEIGKSVLSQMSIDINENQSKSVILIDKIKSLSSPFKILLAINFVILITSLCIAFPDLFILLLIVMMICILYKFSFKKETIKTTENEIPKSNEIKKIKAKKLKEDILKSYKSSINSFNYNEEDLIEENQPSNCLDDSCSICSMAKNDEILSYPIYIYRTKFPFIIDKQPMLKNDPNNDIYFNNDDDFNSIEIDIEEEEEEYEEIPSLQRIIDDYFNTASESDDQNEYDRLYNQAFDEYSQMVQKINHRKRIREKRNQKEKIEEEEKSILGNNFVIQFGICQHPVHPSCLNKSSFKCPIDRSTKNGFLPILDQLPKETIYNENGELSDEVKNSIEVFTHNYMSFFDKNPNHSLDFFIEMVKSISGLIATYEIRLRNLPGCLDSDKTKFLSRNLFLTAWYMYRMCGKIEMINEYKSKLTVFQIFINMLIENDEIENCSNKTEKFKEIFSSFINSYDILSTKTDLKRKDKEIFLLLRRICLSEYFLLNINVNDENEMNNFIDWDEILSISNLSKRYNIEFSNLENDEFELKPFFFTKLPRDFLNLSLSPYNLPIIKTSEIHLFNILDYNFLINNYDDFDDDESENEKKKEIEMANYQENIESFDSKDDLFLKLPFKFSFKVFPTILLFVGKNASELIIIDGRKIADLKPFYLDSYNSPDIGFQRHGPLFLNEERYMKIIDEILSGDFSNHLVSFDEFFPQ